MTDTQTAVALVDENGLGLTQRQYLETRAGSITDYEALASLGLSTLWLAEQLQLDAFRSAYNALFPFDPKAITRQAITRLLPKVVDIIDSALNSEDAKRQAWAVERLLKVTGLEKLQIESISTKLPADLVIAIQMAERGVEVSPKLKQKLKDAGLIS